MATSQIQVTEGVGKYLATNTVAEDALTKQVQRTCLNNSAGAETGVAALPMQVSLANHAANATPVLVDLGAADTLGTVTNLAQMGGQNIALNTGARTAGTLRVTVATDDIVPVVGTAVDDGTTLVNAVMLAANAVETDGTDPTSVSAEADVARLRSDRNRRLLVNTFHPNLWVATGTYAAAQTDVELKAAPGAGLSLYVTDVIFSNSDVAGNMLLEVDTASAKTVVVTKKYMPTTSTVSMHFNTPIRCAANKNLGITTVSCAIHSVEVHGFTAP
jgi:hypothetical protein